MLMLLFAALTLAAGVGPIVWLGRVRMAGLRQWFVACAAAAALSGSALIVGPWALSSIYLRHFVAAALVAVIVASGFRTVRTRNMEADVRGRRLARQSVAACLFGLVLVGGIAGRRAPAGTTNLRFPLESGEYAVLQGGNSLLTNPFHQWYPSDRYAIDVVKVNAWGNRARRLIPARLADYASYDTPVYSPCAGVVEEVVNGVPDNPPGTADPAHQSGNHVLLRCGSLRVLLAHLRHGSVLVAARSSVRCGQPVGRIGNSGYTREPHLHVSAVSAADPAPWPQAAGVPLRFDGRLLVINDTVVR